MFISFFTGKVMLFYGISLIMKEKSNASALVCSQIQSRLGADSAASAPRFGRRWEQIRMPLLPDSPKVIVLEMVGFL